MEDQLVQVLANTQLADEGLRKQAELDLKHAETNPAFPLSLANIACHSSVAVHIRQSALSVLRNFIEKNWQDDGPYATSPTIHVPEQVKAQIRPMLLELALGNEDEKKIKGSVSYVVGKIANMDYPEQWPTLLPTVIGVIPGGTDVQLHGALKVLGDVVDESLSEEQFFGMARDIVKVLYDVAVNEARKPSLRALAVSVFRSCFDMMDMVKEDHMREVRGFAEEALKAWLPFFLQTLKTRLDGDARADGKQPESWNGIVALKFQVVKTLGKIKEVFKQLLLPESLNFFGAVWEELSVLQGAYQQQYVANFDQGRLEDSDGLPYTLDFLVLEELDFFNVCLKASTVQKELEAQLKAHGGQLAQTPWAMDLMKLLVAYAQITREEEDLWDIDVTLYIAEETSVTANYTPRAACGDLLVKLGEWIHHGALDALFAYTKSLFAGGGDAVPWRTKESALYLFTVLVRDFQDVGRPVADEVCAAYLELVSYAIERRDEPLLRARGYLVAGLLVQNTPAAAAFLDRTIAAITDEESELVQVACVKAVDGFIKSEAMPADRQLPIIMAISKFLADKDMTEMEDADDLLITLVDTLRLAISIDKRVALADNVQALDLLFLVAKHGAANYQISLMVCEAFEEIVQALSDPVSYAALCAKVLPSLTGTFDVGKITENDPLITMAAELLEVLVEHGSEPLPPGFVATTLPKLNRLLMESTEGELLRPSAEAVKFMLMHDHHQVFGWHDEAGRSGLEVCLIIIDRLLGTGIEDNAASEVGGLAAELVEKAGHERLGPFLPRLLEAVAGRLATAEAATFIQSLISVFARLSLTAAHDVVEFLSQIQIQGQTGLQVVLSKWLENSSSFAGYDAIRRNVIALSKLYSLNDQRVVQTMVKGDLVVPASDVIMTRSRAKKNPDQYTIIPAPLKIIKLLIEELSSASGMLPPGTPGSAAAAAAANIVAELDEADADKGGDDDDDDWEDEPGTLDLGLGSTKADLMGLAGEGGAGSTRQRDDETQQYLTEFFVRAAQDNLAGFADWYGMLSDTEKARLSSLAS